MELDVSWYNGICQGIVLSEENVPWLNVRHCWSALIVGVNYNVDVCCCVAAKFLV